MRNKKVKDKDEAGRRRIEKSLFGEAEGIDLPLPPIRNTRMKKGRKGAAEITCPYRINRHHREPRQADSKGSMPMAVEDTDLH